MPLKGQEKINYQRNYMRKRRLLYGNEPSKHPYSHKRRAGSCEVCGYSMTVDLHHEGAGREEHILCPNHHALITRGLIALPELGSNGNQVRPAEADSYIRNDVVLRSIHKGV